MPKSLKWARASGWDRMYQKAVIALLAEKQLGMEETVSSLMERRQNLSG